LINIFKLKATARPRSGQKWAGKKEGVLGGRNFCPPAGFWWWVGVRLPKAAAQVKIRRRDFVQNKFEFCLKDTANLHKLAKINSYFRENFIINLLFLLLKTYKTKKKINFDILRNV